MSFYEQLGVNRSASEESIRTAYRALARRHHPDLHGHASPKIQAAKSRKMAEISEAYEVLSNPRSRAEYDRELERQTSSQSSSSSRTPPPPPPPHQWPRPTKVQCEYCGSEPARRVHLRRNVGLLFSRRRYGGDVTLCRSCGLALFRQFQNSTMIKGWWGPISFFINIGCILGNAASWIRILNLDEPSRSSSPLDVPFSRPMPPGPVLFRRAGIWITVVLLFFLARQFDAPNPPIPPVVTSSTVFSQPTPDSLISRPITASPEVGECAARRHGTVDRIVDCSGPHYAMIVKLTLARQDCPDLTNDIFEEPFASPRSGWILCLSKIR
jgi:hypothetical protein